MKIWKRMFPALAVALSAGAGWTGLLRVFAIDDRGALADFIPDIWSARFTEILYNRRVYGAGTNRNYEGDIAMAGDTVKVPTRTGAVTVKDYTKSTDIAAAQEMNGTVADLAVDEQKYFHVYLDDIQRRQQVPDLMDATLMHGAEQVAQVQDQYLMGVFAGAFANARRVISATATNATVALIIASFVELKQKMGKRTSPRMIDGVSCRRASSRSSTCTFFRIRPPSTLRRPRTKASATASRAGCSASTFGCRTPSRLRVAEPTRSSTASRARGTLR